MVADYSHMLTPDGYYSFENFEGTHNGLVRVSGGVQFDRADHGYWIRDQSLSRHFIDPGSDALERVDDLTAQSLAERYGVKL